MQAPLPIRPAESSAQWIASGISQQKTYSLPSGYRKTTYFFDDQTKAVTWQASSDSSAIFTRYCTFKFPFIFVFTKLS